MHAVIFTGGKSPEPERTVHFFSQMNRVDFVIAADSGLEQCEKFRKFFRGKIDFAPDEISGDMDSIRKKNLIRKFPEAKTEIFQCDKDFTDTELALQEARKISPEKTTVTLIGGAGGKSDHFISVYDSFSAEFHADVWLSETDAAFFLDENRKFSVLTKKLHDKISVARLTKNYGNCLIESRGLEWNDLRKTGMASISNRISAKNFSGKKAAEIFCKGGGCLVFVPLNADFSYSV